LECGADVLVIGRLPCPFFSIPFDFIVNAAGSLRLRREPRNSGCVWFFMTFPPAEYLAIFWPDFVIMTKHGDKICLTSAV
jgi:hypothetical protein